MRVLDSTVILALILTASPIHAEEAGVPSPYLVQMKTELPLVALSGAAWLGPKLLVHRIGRPPCPCDPSGINPLDRWVAGRDDRRLSRVSTLVEEILLTSAFVADAAEEGQSADEFGKDAVVFVEAAEVDRGVGEFIKILAHRPRPLDYGKSAGDSALSDRRDRTVDLPAIGVVRMPKRVGARVGGSHRGDDRSVPGIERAVVPRWRHWAKARYAYSRGGTFPPTSWPVPRREASSAWP